MIKFYEFPSTDTLVVLDTEKQLTTLFSLGSVKRMPTDLKTWWGDNDITDYTTRDIGGILDALEAYYA